MVGCSQHYCFDQNALNVYSHCHRCCKAFCCKANGVLRRSCSVSHCLHMQSGLRRVDFVSCRTACTRVYPTARFLRCVLSWGTQHLRPSVRFGTERERESERDREREREKEGLILCSAESNMGKEMNTSIKVESLGLPVSP